MKHSRPSCWALCMALLLSAGPVRAAEPAAAENAKPAADVSGRWKGSFTTPDGQSRETTFVLEAKDGKLTGTSIGGRGERPIEEGTVDGDAVSFVVTRNFGGSDVKMHYKGKIAGDELTLMVTGGRDPGRTFEIKTKREKAPTP